MSWLPRWRRCVLGHRWVQVDSHVYELGRGYETTLVYERCARCGATREHHDGGHGGGRGGSKEAGGS